MLRWLLVTTLLFAAEGAFAKADGVDSRATFPPIGCGAPDGGAAGECHTQPLDPSLLVTIDGPTQIGTGPDDFGFYTVSIPPQQQPLKGAGMNVAMAKPNATGCKLEAFAPIGKMGFENESGDLNDPVLSHFSTLDPPPLPDLQDVWAYQFLVLHCKNPGPLLLLAAMNAFDGSGDETGEIWNKTQLEVTVPEPGAAALGATTCAALASLGRYARRRRSR